MTSLFPSHRPNRDVLLLGLMLVAVTLSGCGGGGGTDGDAAPDGDTGPDGDT